MSSSVHHTPWRCGMATARDTESPVWAAVTCGGCRDLPDAPKETAVSEKMISAYLSQMDQYYSESKEAFLQVSDMHPTYAANAAARILADAQTWAASAGASVVLPRAWMVRQPLFLALVLRASQH